MVPNHSTEQKIYIIKPDVCAFVCQHFNVRLTSPPVLMLQGRVIQTYVVNYDLTEVIKLRFEPKKFFFSK